MMSSSSSSAEQELIAERENFKKQISSEDEDPLGPYERHVKWLMGYELDHPRSGVSLEILVILEETLRKFKDDAGYRGDLRYLKLWLTYAQRIENPDYIYVYLLKHKIGTIYAQLYEDYAISLESRKRYSEVEKTYQLGFAQAKRGIERLKTRHQEYKERLAAKIPMRLKRPTPHISPSESTSLGAKLYRNPLRQIDIKGSKPKVASPEAAPVLNTPTPSTQTISTGDKTIIAHTSNLTDPYLYVRAAAKNMPIEPGRRLEKYRFNFSLLFKDDKEYCVQEARARSMGLYEKKWGPPPQDEPGPHQVHVEAPVDFGDNGDRPSTRTNLIKLNMNMTAQLANEPTVTINTKEALRDVFGMYNSPERTIKSANLLIGTKHAPIRKIDLPLVQPKPRETLRKITELGDGEVENAQGSSKPQSFRPYVDEQNRKENAVPAPAKFKPYVDENANSRPRPAAGQRKGLALKEIPVAPPIKEDEEEVSSPSEDTPAPEPSRPVFQDTQPRPVFKVFTPAGAENHRLPLQSKGGVLQDRPTVFRDAKPSGGGGIFSSKVFSRPPGVDSPFNSNKPREVFSSRPVFSAKPLPSQNENAGREPVFRRADNAGPSQRAVFAPLSRDRERQPFAPIRQPFRLINPEPLPDPEPDKYSEPEPEPEVKLKPVTRRLREESAVEPESEPEPELGPKAEEEFEEDPGEEGEEVQEYDEAVQEDGYYESETPYRKGGRYGGGFMTPIAERTFECTMTTRTMLNIDPSSQVQQNREAATAALQAAHESEEEDGTQEAIVGDVSGETDDIDFEDDDFSLAEQDDDMIERTGTLSLADAIEVASAFKPPNPCNPSDPHIVNTLLSLSTEAPGFYDLKNEVSDRFDKLQKFANKKSRSGRSNRAYNESDSFRVHLTDKTFVVTEKLGEGGFGAVYKAKASPLGAESDDEFSEGEDSDDDFDDENKYYFALKVVKPRNLWEYHILRRIHSSIPDECKRSVVSPHALYAYRDESYLVLDLCTQGTLLDVVNHASESGVSQHGACLDEVLVMFFSIELIKFLEAIHSASIIHGDFKIDNCLLRLEDVPGGVNAWSGMYQPSGDGGWRYKGIKMIDFGRTIDTRVYPSGQKFIADWKTDVYDCPEMRENSPWSYEPDYFGLAGICYCMLFGKYFDEGTIVRVEGEEGSRYKFTPQFKRYWQGDIWGRLFDLLLNPTLVRPDGSLPLVPELASIREEMETWLSSNCNRSTNTLKGLLKKIERSVLTK